MLLHQSYVCFYSLSFSIELTSSSTLEVFCEQLRQTCRFCCVCAAITLFICKQNVKGSPDIRRQLPYVVPHPNADWTKEVN